MMRAFAGFVTFVSLFVSVSSFAASYQIGDVFFQSLDDTQSVAVSAATHSPWAHVGVVYSTSPRVLIAEAIGSGVQLTPLSQFLSRSAFSRSHQWAAKRMAQASAIFTPQHTSLFQSEIRKLLNRPYDIYFGWDDQSIYCSELVFKVYQKLGYTLGQVEPIGALNYVDSRVRALIDNRIIATGRARDLNEALRRTLVSPESIFRDSQLRAIAN